MKKRLTKPQAEALAKWRDGKALNEKYLGVREDVYWRLRQAGYLETAHLLLRRITDKGRAALAEFEGRKK